MTTLATQSHQAGHMWPTGRVFETAGLDRAIDSKVGHIEGMHKELFVLVN